jgi:hypothetical protein
MLLLVLMPKVPDAAVLLVPALLCPCLLLFFEAVALTLMRKELY